MNAGYLSVTNELLKSLLRLPEDANILSIEQDTEDRLRQCFKIVVQHEKIPAAFYGERLPSISYDELVDEDSLYPPRIAVEQAAEKIAEYEKGCGNVTSNEEVIILNIKADNLLTAVLELGHLRERRQLYRYGYFGNGEVPEILQIEIERQVNRILALMFGRSENANP